MQTSLCPAQTSLVDLIAGRIGELDEASLIQHVQQCQNCRQKLADLEAEGPDSMLENLRSADGSEVYRHEPDCHWATSLALGAIAGNYEEETRGEPYQLPMDLGDYRLLEPIAHGGMGIVYRAQHLRLGRDVAVKIISGKRLADKRAIQRFEAEMRTLGQMSHPNIVSALDARELSGQPVLIMEYVDGMDLSKILDRMGPLPPATVAAIGRAVAAALEYSARNGLVHRDVKPSNIMLNVSGEVKLLDLGLARLQVSHPSEVDGTITGLALGTADYMSPEQIHDARNVDVRSDLYSLGCTLYKLLTGTAPYGTSNYATNFSKLSAHVSPSPILVPMEYKHRSPKLASLIERLTSKNRDDRPASAQDVALALANKTTEADLVQLIQLARSAPPLHHANPQPFSNLLATSGLISSTGRFRMPPWASYAMGFAGLPIGIALGMWLTINRPDGSSYRVELPNQAAASIDTGGNVSVTMRTTNEAPLIPQLSVDSTSDTAIQSPAVIGWAMSPEEDSAGPISGGSSLQPSGSSKSRDVDDREISSAMSTVAKAKSAVYRGFPFESWLNLFQKDRNLEILIVAGRALISLADTAEQKRQVSKVILDRCRRWGGRITDDGGHESSPKWMNMVYHEFPKLMPEAGVEEFIEELKAGNLQSRQACETLLIQTIGKPYSWYSGSEMNLDGEQAKALINALVDAQKKNPEPQLDGDLFDASTVELEILFALKAKVPFDELPQDLRAYSQREWEALIVVPTERIARQNSFNYSLPGPKAWLPYWESLPIEQRDAMRILHQIFQDRAQVNPILDIDQLLSRFKELAADEASEIKRFLVQRLADSDFDDLHNPQQIIWPKILGWMVQMNAMTQAQSQAALKIIRDAESGIIAVVGPEKYSQIGARRSNVDQPNRGMGGMGGGMGGQGLSSLLIKEQPREIEHLIGKSCQALVELFEVEPFEFRIRLPGDSVDKPNSSGGMF